MWETENNTSEHPPGEGGLIVRVPVFLGAQVRGAGQPVGEGWSWDPPVWTSAGCTLPLPSSVCNPDRWGVGALPPHIRS